MNNPIPRTGLPKFHEASSLRSFRDSDVVPRMHIKATTLEKNVGWLAQAVENIQRQLDRLRRRNGTTSVSTTQFFPFQLMSSPADPEGDPDAAWRTFRVRAGAVGLTPVLYTDGADENPDDPLIDPNPDFRSLIDHPTDGFDVVVPTATAAFYFWIDCTDIDSPFIDFADAPPSANVASFWSGLYVLVAVVDTLTHEAEKTATVRQYRRSDVNLVAGCVEDGSSATLPV